MLLLKTMLALVIAGVLVLEAQVGGPGEGYYIYADGRLTRMEANPLSLQGHVRRWEIWLYPKGFSTGGREHWGVISGTSASGVLAELEGSQRFEKAWEQWCCPYGRSTFSNPLGPIAVLASEPERDTSPALRKSLEDSLVNSRWIHRLTRAMVTFNRIQRDIASTGTNPFKNVGRTTREYLEQMKEAFTKMRQLEKSGITSPTLTSELDGMLQELARKEPLVVRELDSLASVTPAAPEVAELQKEGYRQLQSAQGVTFWYVVDHNGPSVTLSLDRAVFRRGVMFKVVFTTHLTCPSGAYENPEWTLAGVVEDYGIRYFGSQSVGPAAQCERPTDVRVQLIRAEKR